MWSWHQSSAATVSNPSRPIIGLTGRFLFRKQTHKKQQKLLWDATFLQAGGVLSSLSPSWAHFWLRTSAQMELNHRKTKELTDFRRQHEDLIINGDKMENSSSTFLNKPSCPNSSRYFTTSPQHTASVRRTNRQLPGSHKHFQDIISHFLPSLEDVFGSCSLCRASSIVPLCLQPVAFWES